MVDWEEGGLPHGYQPYWLKLLFRSFFRLAFGGAEVTGLEHVPREGPLIIAPTHRSYLDPLVLSAFLPRVIYPMAKKELYENRLFGALIYHLGAFPVDREAARSSSFRVALRLLRMGKAVVVFPEGGIVSKLGEQMKAGVGALAAMSEAPVLPVYLGGANTLFSWRAALSDSAWLALRVAPPIAPPAGRGREVREEVTRRVMEALAGLENGQAASQ